MSNGIDYLNERELESLSDSADDDVDMASVRCVIRELRALRSAVRFLWRAWADSEGEGQPHRAVFGPSVDEAEWLEENGEVVRKASGDVQAVVRELLEVE